jgi:hypothetical protein
MSSDRAHPGYVGAGILLVAAALTVSTFYAAHVILERVFG